MITHYGDDLHSGGTGQKGLTPDDIDLIILSHLHFDHAGAEALCGDQGIRRVLVSEADLKNATGV